MNPTDKRAAKAETTVRQSAAVASSDDMPDKSDERLRVLLKNLEGTGDQPKPLEWDDVLLGISHHLDDGTSERKAVYDRLLAIESEMKKRGSRGFAPYLVAICIGVGSTLAWQIYGEVPKQIIMTRAPELGSSLGWTKPPADPEGTAVQISVPETQVATVGQTVPVPKAPTTPPIDPEQVHQMVLDLGALRQTVDQLAASQDQMVHQIDTLRTSNQEILTSNQAILEKVAAPPPPPPPPVTPTRKPTATPPSSRTPITRPYP
ncbi:MAG: hypothetical protein WAK55_32995 [Xanthobacteraceae bacterium]